MYGTPTWRANKNVLAGLRHRAVSGGNDENGAVHLGGTGDHVLDVVGVARTVDVRVVALFGLVLDVGGGDGDAASLFFRSVVDLVDRLLLRDHAVRAQNRKNGGGQRRLAVVNVADGADVNVWFSSDRISLLLPYVL